MLGRVGGFVGPHRPPAGDRHEIGDATLTKASWSGQDFVTQNADQQNQASVDRLSKGATRVAEALGKLP